MSDQPLIDVRGLRKRYGRKTVLKGLDIGVEAGQVMALLGANGAGKSTLMRIISGLTKADSGQVRLGGAELKQAGHELRRYIGLVSHAPLLYDNLTAWENLDFFARMYDLLTPEVRMEALLRAVDLWPRRHDLVRTYSRGMTQRLAIARAILHDPPVLLLDEPDTGLDQTSSQMLHNLIRQLGASNRAILFSTHNLEQALQWSDWICILAGGEIVHRQPAVELTVDELRELYGQW
ncbi:MAG: heme ABC exporter ATP-binding protein CcmA [Caldilineaceae bacterium]